VGSGLWHFLCSFFLREQIQSMGGCYASRLFNFAFGIPILELPVNSSGPVSDPDTLTALATPALSKRDANLYEM